MKKVILLASAIFSLNANAQLPSYVPSNGLVGWWPFNGNANDESGNGNNGTVNGATYDLDRNNNLNSSCNLYGSNDYVEISTTNGQFNSQQYTISYWFRSNQSGSNINGGPNVNPAVISRLNTGGPTAVYPSSVDNFVIYEIGGSNNLNTPVNGGSTGGNTTLGNIWKHILFSIGTDSTITYVNGIKIGAGINSGLINFQTYPIRLGRSNYTYWKDFSGQLDDIGIWNRALTQQEVTVLYNSVNCSNNLTISPSNHQLQTGANANFNATTSDPSPSFVWQSDLGQGFQTLNNFGAYSGVNTSNLSIANVQLANHLQPIRVIATSGTCIDTSNVATINITDTCIVTINDTITTLISVTDTLIIDATVTALIPPNNINTIKVFPNPTNDHITINYGNFAAMNGYTLKITNALGQIVFTSPINQQSSYIDLSTWGGNGIYFVQIMDTQNNTIENRKIVLQ